MMTEQFLGLEVSAGHFPDVSPASSSRFPDCAAEVTTPTEAPASDAERKHSDPPTPPG